MILTKSLIESTEYPSLPPIWSSDDILLGYHFPGVTKMVWREIGGDCE